MRTKITRGQSPMHAQASFSAVGPASLSPSSETLVAPGRSQADDIDQPFFLWILAGLIAASVASGVIAMSGVMTIIPSN